jgi:CubicO group peptidase (beta-lactamase class C family)
VAEGIANRTKRRPFPSSVERKCPVTTKNGYPAVNTVKLSLAFCVGGVIAVTGMQGSAARAARAPATPSHAAAQAAGLRALHLCSGYFNTQAPRTLTDATVAADAPEPASDAPTPVVDETAHKVSVPFASGLPPRQAVSRPGAGCTLLPIGADGSLGAPLADLSLSAPDLDHMAWPQGDVGAASPLPQPRKAAIDRLLAQAFANEQGAYGGQSWGIVVVSKGKIVAEDYRLGYGPHIAARTNSMCKSLGATVVGVGVRKGLLNLASKAP